MGHVMTVTGPVRGDALGKTLPHEHLIVDITLQAPFGGLLIEPELTIAELQVFIDQGGRTVVDCGSPPIGRDPVRLKEISQRTGLNVVMGSGWYREPFLDRVWVDQHSIDELTAQLVEEIDHGVGDTGIRPGVIGEIGSEHFVTSAEERIMRAAGAAARETGLTVTTHAARWPNGLQQLTLLTDQGVDPRRVVIGHCDTIADSNYHQAIAATGAYVQFDTVRGDSAFETGRRVRFVLAMQEAGMLDHVLLSHDVCMRDHLSAKGGSGYGFVQGGFVDHLQNAGLGADALELLFVENPRRALTGE
jgi:predicted metal-dependent phosphotriesterase family hydrolase